MMNARTAFIPIPFQESAEEGKLILWDGSTAIVREAHPGDLPALTRFFQELSPESRRRRFFSVSKPSEEEIAKLCDSSNPKSQLTLLVLRTAESGPAIVATASYLSVGEGAAEVAFAVGDAMQQKGISTLLLGRLAVIAAQNGITKFQAYTQWENRIMLDVFESSGFSLKRHMEDGEIEIELSTLPSRASVARSEIIDQVSTIASLRPFFNPRGVAVVGASRDPANLGARILSLVKSGGYAGKVYAVNPRDSAHAFSSVKDLPDPVDLAIVAVPREAVLDVVDECAARKIRSIVVITAGFAEVGDEGAELQQSLLEKVRGYGMRMIGPNCMGILSADPSVRMNATFSTIFPPAGNVGMSSQSGALGIAILSLAQSRGIGLSSFVSVGNKADVSGNDLIQYWEEENNTKVILLYLESFGNPRRFVRIARRVSAKKPIIAVKSGRTAAGKRAAGSHTAALAGNEAAVEALFRQTGVMRAESLEEMFDLAQLMSNQPLPEGNRVAILSNAGGPGVLCADSCESGGLVVAELSNKTKETLSSFLKSTASVANPIDMIASAGPDEYRKAIEVLLAAEEVDALFVLYTPVAQEAISRTLEKISEGIARARRAEKQRKPVVACLMLPDGKLPQLRAGEETIPTYPFPEAGARALSKAAAYSRWRKIPHGSFFDFEDMDLKTIQAICALAVQNRGKTWLSPEEVKDLLKAARLPIVESGLAKSADEAASLAEKIGYPVAVKLASLKLTHKSDLGGVELHLANADAVRSAFNKIQRKLANQNLLQEMDGVIVQPMMTTGVETLVGMARDPAYGPLLAFGFGGVNAEVIRDVQFRIAPLTDEDAKEMMREIRSFPLLDGYRKNPRADLASLQELLLRLSFLSLEVPLIQEVDFNPVFALPEGKGCRIVDARIRVS